MDLVAVYSENDDIIKHREFMSSTNMNFLVKLYFMALFFFIFMQNTFHKEFNV
jgi:hypothetical protein